MNNLSNLSNRSGVEQAEAARKSAANASAIKAALRVVETSSKYLEIAEKTMAADYKGKPISREEYDRAKASHDDAMKTVARGLAESGDTVGATQVLRMLGRWAMPSGN